MPPDVNKFRLFLALVKQKSFNLRTLSIENHQIIVLNKIFVEKNIAKNGKNIFHLPLVIIVLCCLTNCVPNRQLVYLQHDQEIDEQVQFATDTLLRSYELHRDAYLLKPQDIISIRVASITEQEYNFISKYESELGIIRKLNQYNQGQSGGNQGFGGGNNQMFRGGGIGQDGGSGLPAISLDRLNTGFVLDRMGELELPQIGNVRLSGLTITEAEELINSELQGFYETPMVRIQLLNFHFTILGEVENEGRYTIFDPEAHIFDAILLAGNLTEFADRSQIKVVRKNEGAEAQIFYLDLLDENLLSAERFFLAPNDLIIVPPLQARQANRYTLPRLGTVLGIVSSSLSLVALIISLSR